MNSHKKLKKCLIIGGGLAGLISSIHLRKSGHEVVVIEKKKYPFHRVCGEFISNEVKPYLKQLGVVPEELNAIDINRFVLSSESGKKSSCKMDMGGFGISRYYFDNFLYEKAKQNGVLFIHDTVLGIEFINEIFRLKMKSGSSIESSIVLGAFGKRSVLDKNMGRKFFNQRSSYMGVKWHMECDFPKDTVSLHHFPGGYAGLSRVENDRVNFCYLTTEQIFRSYKDVIEMQKKHLSQNPFLDYFLNKAKPCLEKPLVISQVNFESKPAVEDHVLMCGDAAGLIHPLCGNGMAMAIHSAKIAAEETNLFLNGKSSRTQMENAYRQRWNKTFRARLIFGKYAQRLMESPFLLSQAIKLAIHSPYLLKKTVGLSHGKPIV